MIKITIKGHRLELDDPKKASAFVIKQLNK